MTVRKAAWKPMSEKAAQKIRAIRAWRAKNPNPGRRAAHLQAKLANKLRARLLVAFHRNAKSGVAVRDLGCSIAELRLSLENQFQVGMGWANYGAWHIDHRIPLSSFDLTIQEQVKVACHWSNLQPLWARDNQSKGTKTTWQPEMPGLAALVAP